MKKFHIILCILFVQFGFAQNSIKTATFSSEAAEEIFIHYNASLLVPGESLYYKVYNVIKKNHEASQISKVANVKLLNSRGEVIFHHKLNLEDSTSGSDYLIPADLPSGIYTLMGYTNWMKNYDLKGVFESQILIINPYLKNIDKNLSIADKENSAPTKNNVSATKDKLGIELNKDSYGKREKVSISFSDDLEILEGANISVSVRKYDELNGIKQPSSKNFNNAEVENFKMRFLPEMRGRIISGRIENEKNPELIKNLAVAYYVPNAPERFRVFETTTDGSFSFALEEPVEYEKAYLKVTKGLNTDYKINIDSSFIDYRIKSPEKIVISSSIKNELQQRAVYNQIQQSYLTIKSDSITPGEQKDDFFGKKATVYDLDEYTRFSTLEEVFVEIIQFASFKKKGDIYIPNIRTYNAETDFGNPPLLLIDGVIVLDYNDFYYMDAKLIEKISIVRDKYFYGPEIYQGIIIVETIKEDVSDNKADYTLNMIKSQPVKYYYSPNYSSAEKKAELSRIPDYRSQLLWQPGFNKKGIEFFTSDLTGLFKIKIEGFLKNGKGISLQRTFEVTE